MTDRLDNLKKFLREGTPQSVIDRYLSLDLIAEETKFGILENNAVVLDTEATGLSFKKDDLIQIAAAKLVNGKISDWYVTFINPGQEISEDIEHLTHISNDDVKDAPTAEEAVKKLVDFCGDAMILAHNISFDKTFVTKYNSGISLLKNIWCDTLDLSRIAFPRLNSHRLIDLSKAFSLIESTHRADDDVATTVEIYKLILAALTTMPYDLLKCIASLASTEMWSTSYIFKTFVELFPSIHKDWDLQIDKELDNFELLSQQIEQQDIYGTQNYNFSSFSMLKSMRLNQFKNLPNQKKYDVDMDSLTQDDATEENSRIICSNSMQFPTNKNIEYEFSDKGILGKIYSDYEPREEQVVMSSKILDAYRNSSNLVVEAGTGVGKSMAYLIPSIKIAKENNIIVGISTKTNSLLDQLIYHELPLISKQIPNLVYSSLKGARHYICLRKVAYLAKTKAKNIKVKDEEICNAASVAILLSFIEQTSYDDCDGIKVNGWVLPNLSYTCPSHECLRCKCPFYKHGCFVHGARRMASNSDIVITNHSMLFCDVKADGGLLPPIRYWVVDEAHAIEKEARRAFSYSISASSLLEVAKSLESSSSKLNIFKKAKENIDNSDLQKKDDNTSDFSTEQEGKGIIYGLINKCLDRGIELSSSAYLFANNLCLLLDNVPKSKNGYEFVDLWINDKIKESKSFNDLYRYAKNFKILANNFLSESNKLSAYLSEYKNCAIIQREISAFNSDIDEILKATNLAFFEPDSSYFLYAKLNLRKTIKNDVLTLELYDVAKKINECFFEKCKSVILTSATLATGKKFDNFNKSVGLSTKTPAYIIPSSFDYDNNMTVYVAKDIPDPANTDKYLEKLSLFLTDVHVAQGGSILSLFTNRKQMEYSYNIVAEQTSYLNMRILMQKWGLSVKGVKDEFIADEKISLFALKSFWEGFDAPGSTLKGVIICKLPFSRLDDPLNKERKERYENYWFKYCLPESVIETKQAVGRLIRKSTDKGFVILADSRVVSKKYGKIFLDSMPTNNIKILSCNEIVNDIYIKNK